MNNNFEMDGAGYDQGYPNGPMEKEQDGYYQNQEQTNPNNVTSSTIGLGVEKLTHDRNFTQREIDLNQKINTFINEKAGKDTISKLTKFAFLINKGLICLSLIEFLFDRYDLITLFLACAVFFMEIGLTNIKYLYKILFLFIFSILLDIICFFDIFRYIGSDSSYQTGSAGATMTKMGLFFLLITGVLKLAEIIGLWSHALSNKGFNQPNNEGMYQDNMADPGQQNQREPEDMY